MRLFVVCLETVIEELIFEKIGQKRIENVGIFNFDEMGSRGVVGGVVEMRKATVPKDFDTVAESGHL